MTLVPGMSGTFDMPMGLYGTVTGNTWWVDNDGKLHVKFGPDPDDLITRSNKSHFEIEMFVKFSGTEGKVEFNDHVESEWKADTSTDVDISKTGHYDSSTGKMVYTVTVTATGNPTNVKVTDTFASSNLLTLDQNSITISPNKELAESGNSTSSTGFTRIFKEMSHGETVTISYTADVNEEALGANGKVTGDDGKNSITVEDDQGDGDHDQNIVNEIKFSDLSKAAVSSTELSGNKVQLDWKIIANEGKKSSLVGSTISDRIDWNSKEVMKYQATDGKVTIHVIGTDANGTRYEKNVPLTVANNSGQEAWSWTVENIGEPEGTPLTYEITYSTIATKQNNSVSVKNEANNTGGGSGTGIGVVPGTGGSSTIVTSKTATSVTEDYIDWKIIVNVPAAGFDELTVVDTLPTKWLTNHFGKDIIENPVRDGDIQVVGLNAGEDYQIIYDEKSGQDDSATLTLNFKKSNGTPGLDSGNARTITITVRTKNDPEWIKQVAEGNGEASEHENKATVNGVEVKAKGTPVKRTISKKLTGKDTNSAGLPRYQYEVIISGITDASDFDFTDTFDSKYLQLVDPATYQTTSPEFTIGGNDKPWQWNYNGSYIQTEEIEPGKVHFYANTIPVKEDGSVYGYYKINYYLEVKDETALKQLKEQAFANGGKYELKNTVVWDSNPSEAIVEYEVKPVTKEGYFASNDSKERKYNFVIDANPQRFELGENPVELTDEHTDNLSVDYSSVKVYKIPDNVNLGDAKTAAQNNQLRAEWLCSSNEAPWNFNGNEGTFSLADKTHYVITYSAVVIGSKSQTFENIADLNGFISSKKETRDYGSDSSGGGEIWEIKLLKYKDGLTSHGLQGATFQLFRGTGVYTQVSDDQGNTWYEEEKEPMKYGDTAATRATGKVGENITFTTAADGTVTIKLDQVNDGNEIEGGVHYFLKEIDSPAGYQIDSSTEYWAFTLTTDPDEVNYGDPNRRDEYGNRQWIYFYYNDILKMANTETTNPLDVVVNKHWFDKNGNPITGDNLDESYVAEVQLMRKTDNGAYVPIKVTGYDAEENPIIEEGSGLTQLTKDNDWSYTWSKLPRVQMGGDKGLEIIHQYAYKINEVNVQGYVVSMTETENETVKTYALNNYMTPDDSNTDITVNKSWVDSNGNNIAGTAEKLPSEIQFQLYRVVSTTPFDKEPTSGGSLYVINGDSRLVNPQAAVGDDDYGVYRLQKADNWTTTFENLPKVVNENGKTYYYAYYVKEIPMEGYTTTYDVDGETRTIVNREPLPEGEYIDIGLEKKWTDGTTTTPPEGASATFTLHQQKSTVSGTVGTIPVQIVNDDLTTVVSSVMASEGDKLRLDFTGEYSYSNSNISMKKPNGGWEYKANVSAGNYSYTVSASDIVDGNITFRFDTSGFIDKCSEKPHWTNTTSHEPTYSDYEDVESFNRTIALPTTAGSWSTVIKDLVQEDADGNRYQYYITEESCTPNAIETVYKDNLGKDSSHAISTKNQKVEVTNTYETPQTGALKINKAVKFNGNNPSTDTEKALVNKTFTFTITDSNGNPITSGKINGETITDGTVTVTVNNGLSSEVVVTDLEAGEYYIEETDSAGLNLTEATGGTAVTDNKVKVIVTAGDTTASQSSAQASFTNNLVKVDVGILKVDGANKEPLEGAKFSLLRADSATGTYTIVTEIEGVTLDNNHWFTVPEAGVTLCNLTPGYYKIQEEVAPENYVIKERTPIVFVVEENGSLTNNSIADVEYIEDSKLFKVPNEFATELPMTGGIGTTIFYILGSILVIGGGIYFISRRRAMK